MNNRFIPFSLALGRGLSPGAFILFCVIWYYEHLTGERVCFASDKKLKLHLGIKKNHTLLKYKRELLGGGLIVKHKGRTRRNIYSTAYELKGRAIRAAFILSGEYRPDEKVSLLLRASDPAASLRNLAGACRISKDTISRTARRHSPLYNGIFLKFEPKEAILSCLKKGVLLSQKRHIINSENTKINTLTGGQLSALGFSQEQADFIKNALLKYSLVHDQGKIYQASKIVFEYQSKGRIKKSAAGLLYAILEKNRALESLPEVPDLAADLAALESKKAAVAARARESAAAIARARESAAAIARARESAAEAWESLEPAARDAAKPAIMRLADPGDTRLFKSFGLALKIAFEQDNFSAVLNDFKST